jgi:hypothetical protein
MLGSFSPYDTLKTDYKFLNSYVQEKVSFPQHSFKNNNNERYDGGRIDEKVLK